MAPTPREMQGRNQAGRAEEHTVQGRAHGTHEGWHKYGEVCRGENENYLCKRDTDEGGMCHDGRTHASNLGPWVGTSE